MLYCCLSCNLVPELFIFTSLSHVTFMGNGNLGLRQWKQLSLLILTYKETNKDGNSLEEKLGEEHPT